MTYPLQGNYGVRDADAESARPWARALVVRWACPAPSHHSSEASLDEYLRRWNVPAIAEIDTRALTRHLRTHGALRAVLVHEELAPSKARLDELAIAAGRVTPLSEQDLVAQTSRTRQEEWLEPMPAELRTPSHADGNGLLVAVVDYGVSRTPALAEGAWLPRCRPSARRRGPTYGRSAQTVWCCRWARRPSSARRPVERRVRPSARSHLCICLGHQIIGRAGRRDHVAAYSHHGSTTR
jgi:carbamoyl-phosphate synthase small subunit